MAYIDTKHLGKCETCRHHRSGECNTFCDCGEEYSPDMLKIPTEDVVEVKHGHWKQTEEPLGWQDVTCAECSACGETWVIEGDFTIEDYIEFWKYCPCCGAKMDEEGDSND